MEKRLLITRWLRSYTSTIPIYDEASVSSARQHVRGTGLQSNLSKDVVESVALITSELTHNQLSHARQGYFAVNAVERRGVKGLEVIAADIGPGIENPRRAIYEEVPASSGSLRAGLSAVCRLADEVEFDNRIFEGACVVARKFESPAAACCETAIMGRPYPGEVISGDDAVFVQSDSTFIAAVSDGLGHGPEAREASHRAVESMIERREMRLDEMVTALNADLAGTRGCAMSVVRFDKQTRTIESVSAGDVRSHLYHLREAHFFTAIPVVLAAGQFQKQRIRVETVTVEAGSVLVMFTDGLKSRANLKGQLDVLRQPAISIAQHLLENESRPDDDALVLVARFPG
jgi:anti-sigma regulatory factor (Ser/Thr protein kinase)